MGRAGADDRRWDVVPLYSTPLSRSVAIAVTTMMLTATVQSETAQSHGKRQW